MKNIEPGEKIEQNRTTWKNWTKSKENKERDEQNQTKSKTTKNGMNKIKPKRRKWRTRWTNNRKNKEPNETNLTKSGKKWRTRWRNRTKSEEKKMDEDEGLQQMKRCFRIEHIDASRSNRDLFWTNEKNPSVSNVLQICLFPFYSPQFGGEWILGKSIISLIIFFKPNITFHSISMFEPNTINHFHSHSLSFNTPNKTPPCFQNLINFLCIFYWF